MKVKALAYIRNMLVEEVCKQEASMKWLDESLKEALGDSVNKVDELLAAYDLARLRKKAAKEALDEFDAKEW